MFCCRLSLAIFCLIGVWGLYAQEEPVLHEKHVNPRKGRIYENGKDVPFTGFAWKSYASGKVRERVHFVNGVRTGKDIWYYENGKIKSEADKKFRKTFGIMTGYREDGTLEYKKTYVDGFLHGLETTYFRDGKIESSCEYQFDKPDGKRIIYFPDGKVNKQENLSFGKRSGECLDYYDSGKLKERSHYKYDKLNGTYESFFPNGNLHISGNYDAGKQHGEFTEYYENGKVREKTYWEHGIRLPAIESYHPSGKINIRVTVQKDGRIKSELYDESGKLVSDTTSAPGKTVTSSVEPVRITIPQEEQATLSRDFCIGSIYRFSVNQLGCTPEFRNHPLFYYLCRKLCGYISVFNQTRCIEDAVAMAEKDDSDVIATIFVYKVRSRQWKSSEWVRRAKKCLEKVPAGSYYEYLLNDILHRYSRGEVAGKDLTKICLKFAAANVLSKRGSQYLCRQIMYLLGSYKYFPEVKSMIEAIRTENLWMKKTLLGRYYIDEAWRARGSGWAGTVSDEGWKGFESNLKAAQRSLTEAWEMYPDLPEPAYLMIIVSKGCGEVPERIQWFNRAAAAQADYFDAYNALRNALQPRWEGSVELMKQFGDACFDSGLYRQDVVMRMLWMYKYAASEVEDYRWQTVYQNPEVMSRIDECLHEWCVERSRNKSGEENYFAAMTIFQLYAGNFDEAVKRYKEQGAEKFAEKVNFFYTRRNLYFNTWIDPVESLKWLSGPHGIRIAKAMRSFIDGENRQALKELDAILSLKDLDKSERNYLADLWGRYKLSVPAYNYMRGDTSLFVGRRNDAVFNELLKKGIDPDWPDLNGNSLLFWAAGWKDSSMLEKLIKAGANVNLRTKRQFTPLWNAIRYKRLQNVKLLVNAGADVNAEVQKQTALKLAEKVHSQEIIDYLKVHDAK